MSLRDKFNFNQVASIISEFLRVPIDRIGTMEAYFKQLSITDHLEVGISIQYLSRDYKSLVELFLTNDITEAKFLAMICLLAKKLNTDIVIGDVTSKSNFATGEYIIISPDQRYQKAYEQIDDGDIFEVKIYTEKSDVSELLKINK